MTKDEFGAARDIHSTDQLDNDVAMSPENKFGSSQIGSRISFSSWNIWQYVGYAAHMLSVYGIAIFSITVNYSIAMHFHRLSLAINREIHRNFIRFERRHGPDAASESNELTLNCWHELKRARQVVYDRDFKELVRLSMKYVMGESR
jgi:hypothetical protein